MNRNRRQLPDFHYVTIGEDTYYLPYYLKTWTSLIALVLGLANPIVLLAIVAWTFMY